jgi:hypothetical protein
VDWIRHYIQTRWLQSRCSPCASPSNHASCSEDNRMMARVPPSIGNGQATVG